MKLFSLQSNLEIPKKSIGLRKKSILSVMIAIIVYSVFICINLANHLNGEFDQYILPGGAKGIPDNIAAHELKPNILTDGVGWDGSYYYYIANDPFMNKDTLKHIDMAAYRYQRVGVGLTAFFLSKIILADWVSPELYFIASLLPILIATYIGSMFFAKSKFSSWVILLWALGGGPLFTILLGFTDGTADAYCILALLLLLKKRKIFYLPLMILAVLSRELYVVFPAMIALSFLVMELFFNKTNISIYSKIIRFIKLAFPHIVVCIVAVAWQLYIWFRTGITSVSQASPDQLALPFIEIFRNIIKGIQTKNYTNSVGLIIFIVVLLCCWYSLIKSTNLIIQDKCYNIDCTSSAMKLGILGGALVILVFSTCFGKVMVWNSVGYVKANSFLVFIILFASLITKTKMNRLIALVAIVSTVFTIYQFQVFAMTTIPSATIINQKPIDFASTPPNRINNPLAKIRLAGITDAYPNTIFNRVFRPKRLVVNVEVTNLSDVDFQAYNGAGSINVGYVWIDPTTNQIVKNTKDGRSLLPNKLSKGQSVTVPMLVDFPNKSGKYILRLSLVQEGYEWLYNINPDITYDIPYDLK